MTPEQLHEQLADILYSTRGTWKNYVKLHAQADRAKADEAYNLWQYHAVRLAIFIELHAHRIHWTD